MLRLPPTVIGLGQCDIQDYDKRRQLGLRKDGIHLPKTLDNVATVPRQIALLAYRPLPKITTDIVNPQPSSSRRSWPTSVRNLLTPSLAYNVLQTYYPAEDDFYFAGFKDDFSEDYSHGSSSTVSRTVNHESSGPLYSQIPKRARKWPKKALRYQENSYSFDSSESFSPTFEHNRTSSTSTNDLLSSSTNLIGLHQELRGDYLQSSRDLITASATSQDIPNGQKTGRDLLLSNICLPLPPPFSITPRRVSTAGSMPGTILPIHPEDFMRVVSNQGTDIPGQNEIVKILPDDPRAVAPSSSPHYSHPQRSSDNYETYSQDRYLLIRQTLSGNYRVYNDELPPELQPQTPENLPEARHRSRYLPYFTVPDTESNRRNHLASFHDGVETTGRNRVSPISGQSPNTQNISPARLSPNSLDSLYRGIENDHEGQHWVEGFGFNNAQVRLWDSDQASSDDRTLGSTL